MNIDDRYALHRIPRLRPPCSDSNIGPGSKADNKGATRILGEELANGPILVSTDGSRVFGWTAYAAVTTFPVTSKRE
jgi:hypothetical protein